MVPADQANRMQPPCAEGAEPAAATRDSALHAGLSGARVLMAGCGDLGMRVAALLATEPGVGAIYGLRRRPAEDSPAGLQWVQADLADPASLAGLPAGITHVVYSPTPGARDEAAYRRVFVQGLRNLLACPAMNDLRRLVFVSSSAVYGEHHGAWIDEDSPTDPQGFNGRVLLQAEALLHPETLNPGCSATSLRLAGIYGPGRTQLLDRLRQGLARAPIDTPHWANRIHSDDAANACVTLLRLHAVQPCYLGCDDTPLPLHVLYTALARHIDAPTVPVGPAPANIGSKRMRNTRLRSTGWAPAHPDARTGYFAK